MEPPTQIPCSGNCLVHLHSKAGKAWFLRRFQPSQQRVGPDGISRFQVIIDNNEPKFLSAQDIYTLRFQNKIATFERLYGTPLQNIVAIIPASINPLQYQSQVYAAAAAAGVHIVLFIERSVLAASCYESLTPGNRTVLVFELGGHILEISLLSEDQGLNVKAAVFDLDCPLFNYMVSVLRSWLGIRFTCDAKSLFRIRAECERAKDALCSGLGTVDVNFQLPGREVRIPINREWLVQMNFNHLRSGIMRCLMEAGISQEAVDEIVLVGASTNIPAVQEVLLEFFQRQRLRCDINPEHLMDFSTTKYLNIVSTTFDIPVIALRHLNLGLYSL